MFELEQVGAPRLGVLVDAVEMRLVPQAAPARDRPAIPNIGDCSKASTKAFQSSPARGGVGAEASAAIGSAASAIWSSTRCAVAGSDAGQQVQQPEARDAVARIFDETQQRQHVLDVRGIEKFQPAELYERDVAAGQFDFERTAVARCPEQHRLLLQERAGLAVLQDALDDAAGLVGLVAYGNELRLRGGRPLGPEVLGEAFPGKTDDAVGGGEDGLRRAIIAIQRDDAGGRRELVGKVQDVAHGRGAERVDRLGIVADHRQAPAAGLQRQQDRGLQAVRVLVFVDQNVIEAAADVVGQRRRRSIICAQ